MEGNITWEDIYKSWSYTCEGRIEIGKFEVYEVEEISGIDKNKINYEMCFIDWYKKEYVNEHLDETVKKGLEPLWRTAHIVTAKMLYENQDDDEKKALIWLGASMIQIVRNGYLTDEGYFLAKELEKVIRCKMRELEMQYWSHSVKYPFPDNVFEEFNLPKEMGIKNMNQLLEVIALNTFYIQHAYQLMCIKIK